MSLEHSIDAVAEPASIPNVGKPGKQDLIIKAWWNVPSLGSRSAALLWMWDGGMHLDDTKQRQDRNGISTRSFPAIKRNQRKRMQHERGEMAKQLEKALTMAKPHTGLQHHFPRSIQT